MKHIGFSSLESSQSWYEYQPQFSALPPCTSSSNQPSDPRAVLVLPTLLSRQGPPPFLNFDRVPLQIEADLGTGDLLHLSRCIFKNLYSRT